MTEMARGAHPHRHPGESAPAGGSGTHGATCVDGGDWVCCGGRACRGFLAGVPMSESDKHVGAKDALREAFRNSRSAFVAVAVLSFAVNLLILTVPPYLLPVLDKALSRSVEDTSE